MAADELVRVIHSKRSIETSRTGSTANITTTRGIKFEQVSFKYPGAGEHVQPVLQQASFKIESCKVNAIIGRTGSGKSTILKLLCRMYDPDEG